MRVDPWCDSHDGVTDSAGQEVAVMHFAAADPWNSWTLLSAAKLKFGMSHLV